MVRELRVYDKTDIFEIINGCINNEEKYQSKLYIKYYYTVLTTCKKYTNNIHEAEDLTQEIFLKLIRKIGTFRGKTGNQFTSWVKMVSKNCAVDSTRKRHLISDVGEEEFGNMQLDYLDIGAIDDTNQIIANDIKSAISKLSPKCKKVFELYHIQNYSHDEIADELGINVGTSKSNLFKAKIKLSEMLKHYNNNFN